MAEGEIRLIKSFASSTFRREASWDFDLSLSSRFSSAVAAKDFPLDGTWRLNVHKGFHKGFREDDPLCFTLTGDQAGQAFLSDKGVEVEARLFWLSSTGRAWELRDPYLGGAVALKNHHILQITVAAVLLQAAARDSAGGFKPATHRLYRLSLTVSKGYTKTAPASDSSAEAAAIARRLADLPLQQLPHDVLLHFPHARNSGADLWATPQPPQAKEFEDLDDETDTVLFSKRQLPLEQSAEADDVAYRQIDVTQTAYSTYHAVLVYLQTGFIRFAPLSSCSPPGARAAFLTEALKTEPSLPSPVSPKAVYTLAHLLDLEELKKRCIDAIRPSITATNAAAELFSRPSINYDDLRAAIIEEAVEFWPAVSGSKVWKEKTAAIRSGAFPEGGPVLVDVLSAVTGL